MYISQAQPIGNLIFPWEWVTNTLKYMQFVMLEIYNGTLNEKMGGQLQFSDMSRWLQKGWWAPYYLGQQSLGSSLIYI